MRPFWNPFIKGIQMMLKSNSFDKVSILVWPAYLSLSLSSKLAIKLSWVSRLKDKFYRNKESFDTHIFASPVLLTKFGLSVSSVWSPGLIETLTIWSCDFSKTKQYIASQLLDFSFADEPETGREFEVELLHFDMFFTNK